MLYAAVVGGAMEGSRGGRGGCGEREGGVAVGGGVCAPLV